MKVFLDFDDTLFDTNFYPGNFRKNRHAVMMQGGWSETLIDATKKNFSGVAFKNKTPYSYRAHLELLEELEPHGKLEETLRAVEESMKDLERYIFPDVPPFLQRFRKEDLVIVSYGDVAYQKEKIFGSKIDQYVSEVIIVNTGKLEVIKQWVYKHLGVSSQETIWFVDDKLEYFREEVSDAAFIRKVFMDRGNSGDSSPDVYAIVHDCGELASIL